MGTRTIYTGALVLVGDPRGGSFQRVDIEVVDGRIARLAEGLVLEAEGAESERAEVVDASWAWIIPGFVDTHHHMWQATMRGLTVDFTLSDYVWTIRRNHSGVHRAVDIYNGTLGAAVGLLDSGTTCSVDYSHSILTPEHADAGVAAIQESGIRGVWCYGLYDPHTASPYFTSVEQRLDDARRVRSSLFGATGDRVRFGVAPTELSLAGIEQAAQEMVLGRELDCLVHTHTNARWKPGYASEIKQLADAGLLWSHQLHSHCNTSDAEDFAILADHGAKVSSTPETELNMGMGFPIAAVADRAGVVAGLGADIQSNNSPDMFTAMRLMLAGERARTNQRALEQQGIYEMGGLQLSAADVLHFATLGGAIGLGLEDECGSIEVGKAADLVLIRNTSLHLTPAVDPLGAIVMGARTSDIDTVIVGGEVVKQGGSMRAGVVEKAIAGLRESGAHIVAESQAYGGMTPPQPEWWGAATAGTGAPS
ncbi:amidohydrolase family protein [Nocardioides carbamazepini]|uniref:amidohydrolase family protein n=1 Tax=Nocardioides carbamazepini TaxID=2854259 RepID=UPI00214A0E4C|nr:amidohydrolase family protein [Nocardioides carbamazepini]MCR1786730.1 amidohydrolase family protein [Nocardioides carbamazepini]